MLNTWVFKMHEALYLLKYQQHAFFFSFNPMAHKRADNQKIRCNIPPNLVANRSSDNQKVRCIFPSNLVTNKGINSQEIRNILSLVSSYTSAVLTICTTASSSFVSLGQKEESSITGDMSPMIRTVALNRFYNADANSVSH